MSEIEREAMESYNYASLIDRSKDCRWEIHWSKCPDEYARDGNRNKSNDVEFQICLGLLTWDDIGVWIYLPSVNAIVDVSVRH